MRLGKVEKAVLKAVKNTHNFPRIHSYVEKQLQKTVSKQSIERALERLVEKGFIEVFDFKDIDKFYPKGHDFEGG